MTIAREAGAENLGRLKSKLRRHRDAFGSLVDLGLTHATIDRLHLGLKEPYRGRTDGLLVTDAVCFPLLGEGERAAGRYAYLNLPGVTANPVRQTTWGPGAPNCYRLGAFSKVAVAIVSADIVDCWRAWQFAAGGSPECAFLSRSHAQGWPPEWRSPSFWSGFSRVVLLPGEGADDFMLDIAARMDRPLQRAKLPEPHADLHSFIADARCGSFDALLAEAMSEPVTPTEAAVGLGRFEAAPIRLAGGLRDGFAYYPFRTERRVLEDCGRGMGSRLVQRYETVVLRSDGHLLSSEVLPAPRGTRPNERILALSDGTRIVDPPLSPTCGTWSHASIERFADWRSSSGPPPFRGLHSMLADAERHLRARVWLPEDDQYLIGVLYIAMSHACFAFDAIPLLLINGPRGTGKSELGEIIARLSFNATVAGQLRAAGMIRLLDETRGLIVLDDMDGVGHASVIGSGELAQAVKTSYKRSTSIKPLADRCGHVRMVDFFGPKVITNTRSVDAVLGSRMLCIRTSTAPASLVERALGPADADLAGLRDELHCWAMGSVEDLVDAVRSVRRPSCRRDEISVPFRALAAIAGADVTVRLEKVLANPMSAPPPLA